MIYWVTPSLGTAARDEVGDESGLVIVDVRELVDQPGNSVDAVQALIGRAVEALRHGDRVVICCDYGISRSNAVAAGVLAKAHAVGFGEALRHVLASVGEPPIKPELLAVVRTAVGERPLVSRAPAEKCVLVTGGSGFLGRAMVARLERQCTVVAPDRRTLDLTTGVARLDLLVREHQVTDILDLANPRLSASNEAMGSTLVMLRNILDVCRECSTRLIFPSGWVVYSAYQTDRLIASEGTPLLPRGPYGETKYLCECLLQQHQSAYGIRCALVRSGPVFGPGGTKPKFLFTFMKQALRGEPIVTHRYLNGEPTLDLLYIDDFVDILARVVTCDFVGPLNVGTGTATSTADIARMVVRQLGSKSTIRCADVEGYTSNIVMNPGKARAEFGWSPRVGVEEGIRLLCAQAHLLGASTEKPENSV